MLTPYDEELSVGTKVSDRYEIISVVGRGSMGIVYKAKHELIGRVVAIKMLRWQLLSDERSMKRFAREARAASRMDHPNIITVHDFGLTPTFQPYLVMDYVHGINLLDVLKREGHIDDKRAIHIFGQVCDALYHAHEQGVIHRDLKPANIMLIEKEGDHDFVKVVDLGVAKIALGNDKDSERITRTGEVCGSPVYLSPEQCKHEGISNRSDIYALGVVMYELLTGQPPLIGETTYDTIYKHVHDVPAPFSLAAPAIKVPSALEVIVFKALEKDPAKRFQSMLEFRRALDKVLEKQAVLELNVLPPQAVFKQELPMTPGGVQQLAPQVSQEALVDMHHKEQKASQEALTDSQFKQVFLQDPATTSAFKKLGIPFITALITAIASFAAAVCLTIAWMNMNGLRSDKELKNNPARVSPEVQVRPTVLSGHKKTTMPQRTSANLGYRDKKSSGKEQSFSNVRVKPIKQGSAKQGNSLTVLPKTKPLNSKTASSKRLMDAPASSFLSLFTARLGQSDNVPARKKVSNDLPEKGKESGKQEQQLGDESVIQRADYLKNAAIQANNQGVEALNAANFEGAIAKFEQALSFDSGYERAKQNLGRSYNNLALKFEEDGKLVEAEHCFRRALSIIEKSLGPSHPQTAATKHNLALLLKQMNKTKNAARFDE